MFTMTLWWSSRSSRAATIDRGVADLVDDHKRGLGMGARLDIASRALVLFELGHQVRHGGEVDGVAGLRDLDRQRHRQMRLADPRRPM